MPHGNYLVNLGSPDQTIYDKSYACFETELKICDQLQLSWVSSLASLNIPKIMPTYLKSLSYLYMYMTKWPYYSVQIMLKESVTHNDLAA